MTLKQPDGYKTVRTQAEPIESKPYEPTFIAIAAVAGALADSADCADSAAGRAAGAAGVSAQSAGQVCHLRDRGAGAWPDLGLQRAAQPGPGGLLWPRRLRHGDVYEARGIWRQAARLHGLERPEGAALVLGTVSLAAVRHCDGRAAAAA